MRAREVVSVIEAAGWVKERQRGSHAVFRHPERPGLIVVPMHFGVDLGPGLVASILKTAGLEKKR